jgi:hypothetical protein
MKLWHCAFFCVEVKFSDKEQDFHYIQTAKTEGLEKRRCICWVMINLLKTKRRTLYLKTQSVPRCKHFSSRL